MSAESDKLAALSRRLDQGSARIEAARATGYDVAKWETFWFDLLRAYEELAAELSDQAAARSHGAAEREGGETT